MSYLKSLLNALASKVGLPKSSEYVTYELPKRGSDRDEADISLTAPFDGLVQVCSWGNYGCGISNTSFETGKGTLSSGKMWGGATEPSDTRAYLPVRKGDKVTVQLSIRSSQTAQGRITFFKRFGS